MVQQRETITFRLKFITYIYNSLKFLNYKFTCIVKESQECQVKFSIYFILTHRIWENQPYLTQSKWNVDEIFGFKYHLSYVHKYATFFLKSLMRTGCRFCYWICIFGQKSSLLWCIGKIIMHLEEFQNNYFSPSFLGKK